MQSVIKMFLPFFVFLVFTIVLFFFLKEDNVSIADRADRSPKQVKEIFKEVKVHKKETRVKTSKLVSSPTYSTSSTSEVTRVRWHQHNGYERLVFDVFDDNGGTFKIDVDRQDRTKVRGDFIGYGNFTQTLPSFTASTIVKNMEVYTNGNNGYSFTISLYRPMEYKAFVLKNPDRIVIDMY
jgi:ribosomal protein L31E